MGRLLPVLVACILNSSGIYIFRTPENLECFPYSAYVMFLTSIFYLLWNIPLNPYPSCFRDLPQIATLILEFLVATLLIEVVMTDFWCPLQTKFVAAVPTLPDQITDFLTSAGIDPSMIAEQLEFLKSEEAIEGASYILSVFFLICILHTSRVIDLRLLRCGVDVFIKDIGKRSTKLAKSMLTLGKSRSRDSCKPSFKCPGKRRSCSCSDWTCDSDSIPSDSISQYLSN